MRPSPLLQQRSLRHDPGRVDVLVDHVVVAPDLHEVDRVAEARRLEQVLAYAQSTGISVTFCRLHLKWP